MQPKETTAWWGEGFEKGIQTRVDAGVGQLSNGETESVAEVWCLTLP